MLKTTTRRNNNLVWIGQNVKSILEFYNDYSDHRIIRLLIDSRYFVRGKCRVWDCKQILRYEGDEGDEGEDKKWLE